MTPSMKEQAKLIAERDKLLSEAEKDKTHANMTNIRRKLENNPADPQYIFTEIGIGCRMIDNENQ